MWGRGSSTFTLAPVNGEFKCPGHPRGGGGVRGFQMTGSLLSWNFNFFVNHKYKFVDRNASLPSLDPYFLKFYYKFKVKAKKFLLETFPFAKYKDI